MLVVSLIVLPSQTQCKLCCHTIIRHASNDHHLVIQHLRCGHLTARHTRYATCPARVTEFVLDASRLPTITGDPHGVFLTADVWSASLSHDDLRLVPGFCLFLYAQWSVPLVCASSLESLASPGHSRSGWAECSSVWNSRLRRLFWYIAAHVAIGPSGRILLDVDGSLI